MDKIIQNGKLIMWSEDNCSCSMIFGNLTERNIKGEEYSNYLKTMFHDFPELKEGKIELYSNNVLVETGHITK